MTQDDILRMARQSGLKAADNYDYRGSYEAMPLFEQQDFDRVMVFAKRLIAAELDSCAKALHDKALQMNREADDIRARGNTK